MPAKEIRDARARLREAVEEARTLPSGDRASIEAVLTAPVVRLARALARTRFRHLPPYVDRGRVESQAAECAWQAMRRVDLSLDTDQILRFFGQKAMLAAADAAREEDLLPRRARSYRRALLAQAGVENPGAEQQGLERIARRMFPVANRTTIDLVVHGAPMILDVASDDVTAELVDAVPDPGEVPLDRALTDAVHVALADEIDPTTRAWAASVLCGERAVIRVPAAVAPHVPALRQALAGVR